MSLLRRRPASSSTANAPFKPFVVPFKKPAGKPPSRLSANDDDDGDGDVASAARNRRAMQTGGELGTLKRLPILSFFPMPPEERAERVRQQFKSPCEAIRTNESVRLLRVKTLGMRRRWTGGAMKPMVKHDLPPVELEDIEDPLADLENQDPNQAIAEPETPPVAAPDAPPPPPPLVLWESEENPDVRVVVPEIVGKFLRPHQREGVQFMFDCVSRVRGFDGEGCILADDMGLGKTLQSITLMYTLLKCSMTADNKPMIRRSIVVCPTSLVKNWDDEIIKWLHGRVKTIALFEANRDTVIKGIRQFVEGSKPSLSANMSANAAQVLIISYETFRMHAQRFHDVPSCCDLLICDEAHRLKNASSQINQALAGLACRKRVLLSGTPMQNDLEEFFAMVDFTNPNILGTPSEFRKKYLGPILIGREPDATDKARDVAQSCSAMLCEIVNQFILRRGNILNAKHLPPKLMQVVCCPLSPLQEQLYSHFLQSSAFRDMMRKEGTNVLSSITALKKLCNHPLLIFDESGKSLTKLSGFEGCGQFFRAATELAQPSNTSGYRGRSGHDRSCHPEWSGKFLLLDRLMQSMRKHTTDRIVIVSNYTQTLDVVSTLCRERQLPFVRLDGTTSAKKRKNLVDVFNDPSTNSFAFLLSSKAGGCGLNLIGANRLVLFDPDWNPATDKQAAARVWREGQKKMCYVYRFLATGTLEEKIFQRQLSKEGLQNIVDDKEEVNSLSSKDLKRLFVLRKDTMSDTHDQLKCERCQWRDSSCQGVGAEDVINIDDDDDEPTDNTSTSDSTETEATDKEAPKHYHPQIGMPPEEDLNSWGHHRHYDAVDDEIMQRAIEDLRAELVSFAFSCRVDWQLLQDYHLGENEEKENEKEEERKRKRLAKIEAAKKQAEREANAKASKASKGKKRKHVDESEDEEDEEDDLDDEMEETIDVESDLDDFESEGEDEVPDEPPAKTARVAFAEPQTDKWSQKSNDTVANSDSDDDSDVELILAPQPTKVPARPSSLERATTPPKRSSPDRDGLEISTSQTKRTRITTLVDDDENEESFDRLSTLSVPAHQPAPTHRLSQQYSTFIDEEVKESEPPNQNPKTTTTEDWSCSRCTLVNPANLDLCNGCGLRFRRSRLQMPRFIDWDE